MLHIIYYHYFFMCFNLSSTGFAQKENNEKLSTKLNLICNVVNQKTTVPIINSDFS